MSFTFPAQALHRSQVLPTGIRRSISKGGYSVRLGGTEETLFSTFAEAVAARACGGDTARGGELLTDIAAGEDRGWPPGSKPDKIARRIRAQLGALLGGHAPAAALLRALTQDGRLHPGLSDALGDVLSWDE